MVKNITKIQLEKELESFSKEDLKKVSVLINCELQLIDIKKPEENEFTSYYLQDVNFEAASYRYNQWKQKGLSVRNAESLLGFLSKIVSSEKLLEIHTIHTSGGINLPSPSTYLRFTKKKIKTAEEWVEEEEYFSEWEQKKQWASLAEKENYYFRARISGKLYYTLEVYNQLIKKGAKIELETKQEEINWLKEQLKQSLGSEYETKIETNYPPKFKF